MSKVTKTSLLNEAYKNFEKGLFGESVTIIYDAHSLDFEDKEIIFALKCVKFWKEIEQKLPSLPDAFVKGEYLLKEWKNFFYFLKNLSPEEEKCQSILKNWCFGEALKYFDSYLEDINKNDPRILFGIGRCYKGIGDYNSAVGYFESTFRLKKEDSALIAELADCYALINEPKAAKIFFREAFFIDPTGIEFEFLESFMIKRLINLLKEKGLTINEIKEWIPVYGVVYGVFNVKRELKPDELGLLKQSIYSYKKRFNNEDDKSPSIAPRLINYYFRLIDHYTCIHEERGKIDDVLRNIQEINNEIFMEYIN